MTKKLMIIAIVFAFVAGSVATTTLTYAEPPVKDTTLEDACEKAKADSTTGVLCDAIFALQTQLEELDFTQTDPNEPVLEIQVDPASDEPALNVNDGTNTLFTVNNDGSIQIGSNTVIINPDGTVTGGPLYLEAGSQVDGELISTGTHTVDTTLADLEIYLVNDQFTIEGETSKGAALFCNDLNDIAIGGAHIITGPVAKDAIVFSADMTLQAFCATPESCVAGQHQITAYNPTLATANLQMLLQCINVPGTGP